MGMNGPLCGFESLTARSNPRTIEHGFEIAARSAAVNRQRISNGRSVPMSVIAVDFGRQTGSNGTQLAFPVEVPIAPGRNDRSGGVSGKGHDALLTLPFGPGRVAEVDARRSPRKEARATSSGRRRTNASQPGSASRAGGRRQQRSATSGGVRTVVAPLGTETAASRGPAVSQAAKDLFADACRGLGRAMRASDPADRYATAHLAALRATAAILAARARPGRGRQSSAWDLLSRVAPEFGEWATFFAAGSAKRRAAEAGIGNRISAREADDMIRSCSAFLDLVDGSLA